MNYSYDDIIDLPHHVSPTRQPMSLADRAAQFSPFAALTGHGSAISETARLTNQRIELDEDYQSILAIKLNRLEELVAEHPHVGITYFQPDNQKSGGAYVTATDAIKKIDSYENTIVMMDGTIIPIPEILEVEGEGLGTP